MTKDLILVALGAWIALMPFLGFPSRWDTFIFVLSGILVIVLVLMLRRDFVRYVDRIKARRPHERGHFVEHVATHEHEDNGVPPPPPPSPPRVHPKHDDHHEGPPSPPKPRARKISVLYQNKREDTDEEIN